MQKIKVVVVDDHAYIVRAIHDMLRTHSEIEVVAAGGTGEDVYELVRSHRPDVLLLDQTMPESSADTVKRFKPMPAIRRLRRDFPDVRIVILSAHADPVMI